VGIAELLLIAVGLSMDAFAVSVCKGLGMRRINVQVALVLALLFGGFQGLMPVLGWFLGNQLLWLIEPVDHWIAFCLLGYIGGKMIWDAFHEDEDEVEEVTGIVWGEFLMLAVATSIDALAVGLSFAALSVSIAPAALLIFVTTFVLSLVGVAVGNYFGARFQAPAQVVGGVVLVGIGVKTLLEHLAVAPWL
jgi:putative Mn2+ efflux pump MntP